MALVGCPDRRVDRLCVTCCLPSQPSHHAEVGAISSMPQVGGLSVAFAPGHHCPRHAGDLVGECDGGNFGGTPCQQGGEPGPMSCAMDLGIADYG
jgi:hypothetical protein